MSAPSCVPVVFGPGITPHCPAAPWWDIAAMNPARLGWWILAAVALAWLIASTDMFIRNRWEIARGRVARRWYCAGCHVRNRDSARPERYVVRDWHGETTNVPWLLVEELWDVEGADPLAFWAPVTSFASVSVRRFRPRMTRGLPRLFDQRPLRPVVIWQGES